LVAPTKFSEKKKIIESEVKIKEFYITCFLKEKRNLTCMDLEHMLAAPAKFSEQKKE
jgi:hypothetical protein